MGLLGQPAIEPKPKKKRPRAPKEMHAPAGPQSDYGLRSREAAAAAATEQPGQLEQAPEEHGGCGWGCLCVLMCVGAACGADEHFAGCQCRTL